MLKDTWWLVEHVPSLMAEPASDQFRICLLL